MDREVTPPAHWHVKRDRAEFYVAGKLVLCIPADLYLSLIADLSAAASRSQPVTTNP